MNPLERLDSYLGQLHRRLTLAAAARGAAVLGSSALGATLALSLVMNGFAFSSPSITASRIALALAVGAAVALGVVIPVLKLTRNRAAAAAERTAPGLEQRLLTVAENREGGPFIELVAADALDRAPDPRSVVSTGRIAGFASGAMTGCACLVWLVTAGPGYLGHGASLLWGAKSDRTAPLYSIVVTPGDRTVRRNGDQLVTARLEGFASAGARLFARYQGATKWEQASMQPRADGNGFEFLFAGIPDSVDYYVEARGVRSRTHRLSVKDLPNIKGIRVTYRYPEWTGLPPATEDPGGDLRAVEGTEAEVAATTDRPLENGVLVIAGGEPVRMDGGRARVPIRKDGSYYIASNEDGELVRLTDDYFIEAQPDTAPVVRIERPARDARVSPIEEVTVQASASDDFGLRGVTLHYSVNGGPEQTIEMSGGAAPALRRLGTDAQAARSEARGSATLYLEDFKLVPGDIVSLYATARDARTTAKTDIYFVQAQPFERRYRQAQAAGEGNMEEDAGAGEGGISERQKEIIAATWNEMRGMQDRARSAENARFLSDVQMKLRDQAGSLARRMRSRELSVQNEEFQAFSREMEQAAQAMTPAAERLKKMDWQEALAPEQQALQHLLRAEALFRDIQVAFGSQSRRGRQGGAGRELESLFDLELDTEKNQYEIGARASAGHRDRDLDETFQKLRELARRQQELAQQRNNRQQGMQQRWQQEMLRREAEELRRRIEEMAQSGQGSESARGAAGQLQRAMEEMRRAASQPQGGADAERAAERLRQAQEALEQARREQAASEMGEIARRAGQMSAGQENYVRRLQQQFGQESPNPNAPPRMSRSGPAAELAKEREKMLSELERLENDMERAARGLGSTEPDAAARMRDALGRLQDNEVRARVRFNAELLRRGYGQYTVMREAPITRALQDLNDNLQQAQQALGRGRGRGQGGQGETERALREVERLRRELEQRGEPGGMESGGPWTGGRVRVGRALQNFPELARKIEWAPAAELASRLAQVELELRRKLGEDASAETRSQATEPVPPGYGDAVAEYFRRLSKKP